MPGCRCVFEWSVCKVTGWWRRCCRRAGRSKHVETDACVDGVRNSTMTLFRRTIGRGGGRGMLVLTDHVGIQRMAVFLRHS